MKNRKIKLFLINLIYLLFTTFLGFIILEYLYDMLVDFERFKYMHSLEKNWLDLIFFIGWLVASFLLFKLDFKKLLKDIR